MIDTLPAGADAELRKTCVDVEKLSDDYAKACRQELRVERDPNALDALRVELSQMRGRRDVLLADMAARSAISRAGARAKAIALLISAEAAEPTAELELARSLARDRIRGCGA